MLFQHCFLVQPVAQLGGEFVLGHVQKQTNHRQVGIESPSGGSFKVEHLDQIVAGITRFDR